MDGESYLLGIVDTAGNEHHRSNAVLASHGFLLVYDVTSRRSFEELASSRDRILASSSADRAPPIMVLVGNKSDRDLDRQVPLSQCP